jgi:heme-degrading monooxygenase HmoA
MNTPEANASEQAAMIAVIFEFTPAPGKTEDYFALGAALKAEVENFDGFISIERFQSVNTPGKFVSLSFWRDETALTAWRNRQSHRAAQARGRGDVFSDYRLRVASVMRDYGMHERAGAPADSRAAHG